MSDDIGVLVPEAVSGQAEAWGADAPPAGIAAGRRSAISEAFARVTQPSRLHPLELAFAAASFALLAVAVYLPHLLYGGWYSDDWGLANLYHFAPGSAFIHTIEVERATFGNRPLLWVDKALMFAVLGMHARAQLAVAVALAVLVATGFFAVLRMLGLATLPSAMIAGLSLVFPWYDSTHLWATAGLNQMAVLLYLGGTLVAFAGLARPGRRGLLLHGMSLVLYATAMLTYEAVAGLIVMNVLLYWVQTRSDPRDRKHLLLRRWLADCAVVLITLAWSASAATSARPAPGIRDVLGDIPSFTGSAAKLVVRTLWPIGPLAAGAILLVAVVLLTLRRGSPGEGAARAELRTWSWVAALAAVGAVFAFAPLVGSGLYPFSEGIYNRGNVAVALPLSALVFAVVAILTRLLLPRRVVGERWMATVVGTVLVFFAAYVYDLERDITRWDKAATLQSQILTDLHRAVPHPFSHEVLFAYGPPAYVSPGILIFASPWDLNGATRISYGNGTIAAYPIAHGVRLVCGPSSVYPLSESSVVPYFGPRWAASYNKAVLVNLLRGESQAISSESACKRLTAEIQLGPTFGLQFG